MLVATFTSGASPPLFAEQPGGGARNSSRNGKVKLRLLLIFVSGLFLNNYFVQLTASEDRFLLPSCTAKVHSFRKKAFFLALGAKSFI
ncbi:MAG: hypothetical protein QM579_14070 [Desulfovibrio sp.]|uniref:hypothetical protein n=1 Tax=Desulfovibrio sp. TaxID=885 RepID=UPI0039E5752E